MSVDNNDGNFFNGTGETAKILKEKNWETTTISLPRIWKKTLHTNINILLNSTIPMFLFWGDEYFCFYNDAFTEQNNIENSSLKLGLNGEDFWGAKWSDVKFAINNILLSDKKETYLRIYFKNFLSCAYIHDEQGKTEGILILCKKNDNAYLFDEIENDEPFTKSILANSPDCIKVIDRDGAIVYMNDNGVDILEANSKEDFLFKQWTSLWADEYIPLLNDAIVKGFEGFVTKFEAPASTMRGTPKWWQIVVSPIKNNLKKIENLLVTSRDVTNHKQDILKIAESEQRFKTLADNIPNLAWMANADGWIYWYNKKWYEYTGTTEEEMEGWGWQSVHDVVRLPDVMEKWTHAITIGEPFEMVFPLKAANGSFNHFLTRILPIKNKEGSIEKWFGTNTNVSNQINVENELKESEERFRNLADQSPVWVWIADEHVNIIYANNSVLYFLGIKNYSQFDAHVWEQVTHPDDIKLVYEKYEQGAKTLKPFSFESRAKNAATNLYEWIYFTVAPRFINEIFVGFIGTAFNIQQKKEQEFALQQSLFKQNQTLAQLNSLLKNAPVGFAFFNKQYQYVQINECLAEINGISINDHIGKTVVEILGETGKDVINILDKIVQTKEPVLDLEIKGQTQKEPGVDRYWITGFYPILNTVTNEVDFVGAVVFEITERKKIEEQIKESENRFRSLAETIPQLVWETDEKGNGLYTSSKWNEFFKSELPAEEAWKEMVHPDDYDKINNVWQHSLHTGEKYIGDVRLKNKAGNYIWHTVAGDPVFDKEKNIVKWIGAFTDINTEKEFANSLQKLVEERTNELAKANDFLEIKNEELERMNKELQSFAYISSHDLQEPLRKIQVFSAQIMDKEFERLSEDGKNKFERIENSAKRMKTLIEDLLAYSRTSITERKFEKTDLTLIIDQVTEDLKEEILFKNANVKLLSSCVVPIIPFQFRQLIYNLISNGLKFTNGSKSPQIVIKCSVILGLSLQSQFHAKNEEYCHISISDNGIGFEQKYSSKIFEVFQRLHGKTEFSGTGIGLAIVKKIVDNHNGFITAEGVLEKGATFNIYIPYNT